MNTIYPYNDELYHHGVKGQRWGVLRSRTAVLYDKNPGHRAETKNVSSDNKYEGTPYKKSISSKVHNHFKKKYPLSDDPKKELKRVEGNPNAYDAYGRKKTKSNWSESTLTKLKKKYPLSDDPKKELKLVEGNPDAYDAYGRKKTKSTRSRIHRYLKKKYPLSDDPKEELKRVEGNPNVYDAYGRKKKTSTRRYK